MPKKINRKIILLFGPTASGKSKLEEDIAKIYDAEIVNADSMQIYKEVKILSARPEKKILNIIYMALFQLKKDFQQGPGINLQQKKLNK